MKFLTYVSNMEQIDVIKKINKEKNKIDIIVDDFDLRFSKNLKIKKWFLLDVMPFNNEMEPIKKKLKELVKYNFYGVLIQDISILNIIIENNIPLKIIIDTSTGGNNIEFYRFFEEFKEVEAIFLSRELPISQILSYPKLKINFISQIHGLLKIFHTKRKLVSTMKNSQKLDISNTVYLQEPKRDNQFFKLEENESGTLMYHSKIISLFKYLDNFDYKNIIGMIDLRNHKDIKVYEKILNIYINNDKKDSLESLEKLPLFESGRNILLEKDEIKEVKNDSIGKVIDSSKFKYIVLNSNIKLEKDNILLFINDKKKHIEYRLTHFENFSEKIYIIPWRKGIVANSDFYLQK